MLIPRDLKGIILTQPVTIHAIINSRRFVHHRYLDRAL